MEPIELLIMLAIGAVAGLLAGKLMNGGFGLVGSIVLGLIGAVVGTFIGGFLNPLLGLPEGNGSWIGTLIWSTIGAALVLFIMRLIKKS